MADLLGLIRRCLDRGHSVEIVRCGQFAEPGRPYLCAVRRGGFGSDSHLVYGDNAENIMREAMEHVLANGFTQPQDRYGLGRKSDAERGLDVSAPPEPA
jgi:hypothetical protein